MRADKIRLYTCRLAMTVRSVKIWRTEFEDRIAKRYTLIYDKWDTSEVAERSHTTNMNGNNLWYII